ncbi:MAG TPA: hypothetical protein VGG19_02470, partial [Tepidisphaeraceae bacterium]
MDLMPIENSLELRNSDVMDGGGTGAAPVNPAERLHSLLRGRYWLAFTVGGILAVLLGALGYIEGKVQYMSLAQVRIKPNVTVVMYQGADADKGTLPMFNSYVATQAELIQSERVIDLAMSFDNWKRSGLGVGPDVIEEIQKNLVIVHDPQSFLINVQYLGTSPSGAQATLQSILDAYKKLYAQADSDTNEKRRAVLEARLEDLSASYA